MMSSRVRRFTRLVVFAAPCGLAACASANPIDSALSVGTGKIHVASRADSNILVVQLAPAGTMRPPAGSADGSETPSIAKKPTRRRSSGMLRIMINDESFEYHLTVYNDDRRIYQSARIYEGDPVDGGKAVATLFADLSLSGLYIQVRGTAALGPRADSLASRLRQHPSSFVFRLEPRVAAAGALIGSVPEAAR